MRPGPSFRVPRGSLAKLIPYALGVWPLLAAALVCILTGSLLELAVPWVMGFLLLDTVIKEARLDELPRVVFLLVAIFVGQKGVGLFQDYFEELANQRLVHRLRCDLFHHLQHLPVRFFDRGRTGELTARVTSDIDSVEGFLPLLVDDVVTDAVLLLGTLYFLFRVEPRLTLYIAPTILALVFMLFLFKPRVRRFARRVRSMIGDLAAMASETLAGVRVVKGFLGEDYEERRFAAQSLQVLRARVGVVMLRSVSSATVDLGVLLGTVIVVSVAAPKVVAGTFSVGALVAYLGYLSKLYGPAKRLSKVNVSIQKIVAAAERIFAVSDLPPEERADAVLAVRPVPPPTVSPESAPSVRLEHHDNPLHNQLNQTLSFQLTRQPVPAPSPAGTTIANFNGLSVNGASVTSYTESGFTVSPTSGAWVAVTTYGNPAPFIQFNALNGTMVTGAIQVTAGGTTFNFKSVDLYSSTTPIPYTITGLRNSTTTLTMAATLPNTFGNFATVVNPQAADVIDTLVIRLSNPAAICCANPMGVDNIVVTR